MEIIRASSPGRISLAGEKLDWLSGGKGITCAISEAKLTVQLKTKKTKDIFVSSRTNEGNLLQEHIQLPLSDLKNKSYIRAVLLAFEQQGVVFNEGLDIQINSKIPTGMGMSSSAALCVSIAGAIAKRYNLSLNKTQIANLAYIAEREILGVRCGQMDQHAVTFGGICQIDSSVKPANVLKLPDKLAEYSILIANPGIEKKTNSVNAAIQEKLNNSDKTIHKYIDETTNIVNLIASMLQSKDDNINELGKAITQAHFLLSDCLGVSTVILDNIVKAATNAGAYGAKLGSGKGGVVFAIADSDNSDSVEKAMNLYSEFNITKTKMDHFGLIVES